MSSAPRIGRYSDMLAQESRPLRNITWIGLKRLLPGRLRCGPFSSKSIARPKLLPVLTSLAAAATRSGVTWLSVPNSSSGPHLPHCLLRSADASRSLKLKQSRVAATSCMRCPPSSPPYRGYTDSFTAESDRLANHIENIHESATVDVGSGLLHLKLAEPRRPLDDEATALIAPLHEARESSVEFL